MWNLLVWHWMITALYTYSQGKLLILMANIFLCDKILTYSF